MSVLVEVLSVSVDSASAVLRKMLDVRAHKGRGDADQIPLLPVEPC